MPRVVVNSTPLIVLSKIGHLDLLRKLYAEVYIPQAVFDEVTAKADSACAALSTQLDWIHVCKIRNEAERRMYQAKLHAGEVEVMILAQEPPRADLLVIDDNAAKKTAKFLGLTVTGTLGVILKAKRLGYIESASNVMEQLRMNGFYVSPEVLRLVKTAAEE